MCNIHQLYTAVQWRKKLQQQSHATLKSKLQIQIKMNIMKYRK